MTPAKSSGGFTVQREVKARYRAGWAALELALSGALGLATTALVTALLTRHAQAAPFAGDALVEVSATAAVALLLVMTSLSIAALAFQLTKRDRPRR